MHVEVRRGHYKGQIVSARDLPTGCQQQCSLVVPTVRAPRCLTEPSAKSHLIFFSTGLERVIERRLGHHSDSRHHRAIFMTISSTCPAPSSGVGGHQLPA